jgi:hypothetical protein
MTFTVAWMDIGDRVGLCPRCIDGPMARNAAACDLVPVGVAGALGKACARCSEPLAGDALAGARILAEEWVVA